MITRLLGRPLLVKALLCSFLLHLGTISAFHFWWLKSANEYYFLVDERGTIRLEAAFAKNPPAAPIETRIGPVETRSAVEPPSPPDVDGHNPASTLVVALDTLPRKLSLMKREAAAPIQRSPNNEVRWETSDVGEILARRAAPVRRANESAEAEVKPAEVSPQLARRAVDVPTPQTTIAVEHVDGIVDKTPPDFTANRPPTYPAEAIRRRLEGTVLLRLHVAATGRVERVDIVETSGHAILDGAAVEAIGNWRGRPAHRAGQSVATVELLPVRFKFRD